MKDTLATIGAIFVVLALLISLGGVGYVYFEVQRTKASIGVLVTQTNQALAVLNGKITSTQTVTKK
jgi:hypothetical protein